MATLIVYELEIVTGQGILDGRPFSQSHTNLSIAIRNVSIGPSVKAMAAISHLSL